MITRHEFRIVFEIDSDMNDTPVDRATALRLLQRVVDNGVLEAEDSKAEVEHGRWNDPDVILICDSNKITVEDNFI